MSPGLVKMFMYASNGRSSPEGGAFGFGFMRWGIVAKASVSLLCCRRRRCPAVCLMESADLGAFEVGRAVGLGSPGRGVGREVL